MRGSPETTRILSLNLGSALTSMRASSGTLRPPWLVATMHSTPAQPGNFYRSFPSSPSVRKVFQPLVDHVNDAPQSGASEFSSQ